MEEALTRFTIWVLSDEPLVAAGVAAALDQDRSIAAFVTDSLSDVTARLEGAGTPSAVLVVVSQADAQLFGDLVKLRERSPSLGACVIADAIEPTGLQRILKSSTAGFALITRSTKPTFRDLAVTLRDLVAGQVVLPPRELESLVTDSESSDAWSILSDREREVFELVATGMRNREIARRIGCSDKVVERLVGRLYDKFELQGDRFSTHERRVLLARLYLQREATIVQGDGRR